MSPFLVHKIFTFYINCVLNCKCPAPGPKGRERERELPPWSCDPSSSRCWSMPPVSHPIGSVLARSQPKCNTPKTRWTWIISDVIWQGALNEKNGFTTNRRYIRATCISIMLETLPSRSFPAQQPSFILPSAFCSLRYWITVTWPVRTNVVLWNMTPCRVLCYYWRFGRNSCFCLQSRRNYFRVLKNRDRQPASEPAVSSGTLCQIDIRRKYQVCSSQTHSGGRNHTQLSNCRGGALPTNISLPILYKTYSSDLDGACRLAQTFGKFLLV